MDQSLKRSISSSLDLAPDARATQARRSAQPSNQDYLKVFLDPPSPPAPPAPKVTGSTLLDLEMLIQITKIKGAAGEEYVRCVDRLHQLLAVREASEELRKGKCKSGGAQGEGASDKRAVAVEARERPKLLKAFADALAAKGLPDDGSNCSESFLDARRAAYWKADQLGRQEQDQDAAEQAETSKQGQQALKDRGPDARPKQCPRH